MSEPPRRTGCEPDPADLIADLCSREPAAFMRVYDRCVGSTYPLALVLVENVETAEAVIEDVFLALWRNPDPAIAAPAGLHHYLANSVRERAFGHRVAV